MPDPDLFEDFKKYLPQYLTHQQTSQLFAQLTAFPAHHGFYLTDGDLAEQLLQGDGWRGFVVREFHTGDRKTVSGVILSNTCDIDAANARALPTNIAFAPLIELRRYVDLLRRVKTEQQIVSMTEAIRAQRFTSIFYLPAGAWGPEGIVLLDDVHAHPMDDFLTTPSRQPLFTLSQYAFYVFAVKLSIHFMRLTENVRRFDATRP